MHWTVMWTWYWCAKLRAPGNPEFAIGAVDETGWIYLGDQAGI